MLVEIVASKKMRCRTLQQRSSPPIRQLARAGLELIQIQRRLSLGVNAAIQPASSYLVNQSRIGLGREIYNNRQSRNNDAYTGGDNIPEFFKDAARLLYNMSDGKIDVSPNTMYFFANNYLDGVSRLASWSYNTAHTIAGLS